MMADPRISFIQDVSGQQAEILETLSRTRIVVGVASIDLSYLSTQVLVFQLSTLLVRLFDRVEIDCDTEQNCSSDFPFFSGPFVEGLHTYLQSIRPLAIDSTCQTTTTVVVGLNYSITADVFVGCRQWTALVSRQKPQPVVPTRTTVGALAAGTLAAAEVFKTAFKGLLSGAVYEDYALSMLTYDSQGPDPEALDCDVSAVLFGVGSVGCAFLNSLLLYPRFRVRVTLVDNGKFETKNSYKYPLLPWQPAQAKLEKSTWARDYINSLGGERISADACVGTAESYVAGLDSNYLIPLAISAVDNYEARMEIQDTLPEFILNAGIDGTLAEVSIHGFGEGPCLSCICLQRELESWRFKELSEAVGLSQKRVNHLIRKNLPMSAEDIESIRQKFASQPEVCAELSGFVGQPLLSFWNKAVYSETIVGAPNGRRARVTTAFVSAFAGVLLLSEMIKRANPLLREFQVANSYQQQLLGIPCGSRFRHERDKEGICICHSTFRQAVYRRKYL
jgi:hypothetical protein